MTTTLLDPTHEQDAHIAAMRQFLLKASAEFEAGGDPPGLAYEPAQNEFDDLWFMSSTLPAADSWRDRAVVERVTTHRFAAR